MTTVSPSAFDRTNASQPSFAGQVRLWLLRLFIAGAFAEALLFLQTQLGHSLNKYDVQVLTLAGIAVILAVSLNLVNGITGQFSLGHAGFMAIGAYSAAAFSKYGGPRLVFSQETVFVLALLAGAAAAGVAGLLVGLPSLRLRGDYLAIVTLGFGQIIVSIIQNTPVLGAATGLTGVPRVTNFAWVWGLALLCILTVRNLADSSLGRSMRAVRDDEVAAEAVGIDTTRVKVLAFVVSSMWAGVAGGLQAHLLPTVHPDNFTFLVSIKPVVMVVLGGLGSISGSAIAAIVLSVLEEKLRDLSWVVATGVFLCLAAAALTLPRHRQAMRRGIAGWVRWLAWPSLSLLAVIAGARYGQPLLQANHAIESLRYLVYALILIVLMLLRPQGLFGRAELGLHLFGRKPAAAAADAP